MLPVKCLVTVVLCLATAAGLPAKLAPFMEPCNRNDPKLDECIVKHGAVAIPKLIHGDAKYGIPNLDPLSIKELAIRQGTNQVGLNLVLTDAKLYGNAKNKFVQSRTDLKKRTMEWDMVNESGYQLLGNYKASGKVLVLPISGSGKGNITIGDTKTTFKIKYGLAKKKGKEYINITDVAITNKIGRTYFKIENLFNGDKLLGDNMNQFLNDNWKELSDEFEPVISSSLALVYKKVLSTMFGQVPYDEVFPNKP